MKTYQCDRECGTYERPDDFAYRWSEDEQRNVNACRQCAAVMPLPHCALCGCDDDDNVTNEEWGILCRKCAAPIERAEAML